MSESSHLQPYMLAAVPARMGAAKPPMLLEAVQKPQNVPRSLSAYHDVRKRAHAGAPSPCRVDLPCSGQHAVALCSYLPLNLFTQCSVN